MGDLDAKVEGFLLENMLFGDELRLPRRDESLIAAGVIDSTGILELIEFLEQEFDISIDDTETTPDNLDGVNRIVTFVTRKQAERALTNG